MTRHRHYSNHPSNYVSPRPGIEPTSNIIAKAVGNTHLYMCMVIGVDVVLKLSVLAVLLVTLTTEQRGLQALQAFFSQSLSLCVVL